MYVLKLGVNTVLFKKYDVATALKAIAGRIRYAQLSCIQGMCEHLVLDAGKAMRRWARGSARARVELLSMECSLADEGA